MTTHVAFVRAVMIGREGLHREVLLDLFGTAGAREVHSYISTGNVSFELDDARLPDLVDDVERAVTDVVGRPTEVFVRSLEELQATIERDPFATSPFTDAQESLVIMFRDAVPAALRLPIESTRGDWTVFDAGPREVFAVCRDVDGRRQTPGGVVERLAGERMTSRAWSTIERIVAKLT
ncbi:MAG: DUF1697 domain-containing protein [Ilumatobacter sp.]|uniref:DUF1697 domain-containing protein n=1 Tax=Ilumatobacter sp. TaxID=1967498 RepID=UPI0026243749|nr:DUF1697 domain-containing protein [Ilumatobacter sp.]MDJ0768689.1 DUF1697 domain-containing protein [Ilumatobacter sp.]